MNVINKYGKGLFAVLFCILCQAGLLSADTISMSSFLLTVQKDYDLDAHNKKIEYLSRNNVAIPFLDDIEFKIKNVAPFSNTTDFFDRYRYSIRLSPNGIGQTFAGNALHRKNLQLAIHKRDMKLNGLLKNRYSLIIDYLAKSSQAVRYSELILVYEDRIKILDAKVNDTDFDFEMLIETEDKYTNLQLNLIEIKKELQIYKEKIKSYVSDSGIIFIDTAAMISVDSLYQKLVQNRITIDTSNIYMREGILELDEANLRARYEQVSKRKYLSYFEFGYDQDKYVDERQDMDKNKSYDFTKAFSLGLGISIPILTTKRDDFDKTLINKIKAQENFLEINSELVEQVRLLNIEIMTLKDQYNFILKRHNEIRTDSSLKKYIQQGEEPLKILKIKESAINGELRMDKLRFDIYNKYIKMLDITGQLSKMPLRNYLSENQEK
jgi:hypothetical protein